jgi:hypothetical protein
MNMHSRNNIKVIAKHESINKGNNKITELRTILQIRNLIQPTISLEMPVPSQGHYGFHSFPVVD